MHTEKCECGHVLTFAQVKLTLPCCIVERFDRLSTLMLLVLKSVTKDLNLQKS